MHFEYTQYVRGCLILPIFVSLFALSMLISGISYFVTVIIKHKLSPRDSINFLFAVVICSFFLCMNIGRLLHGGFHLIHERESNAVEFEGEILEIKGLGRYSFPEIKTEYGYGEPNGVQFSIDGIECTAVTRGDLKVGDKVTVMFLPQSGYILSIHLNNEE